MFIFTQPASNDFLPTSMLTFKEIKVIDFFRCSLFIKKSYENNFYCFVRLQAGGGGVASREKSCGMHDFSREATLTSPAWRRATFTQSDFHSTSSLLGAHDFHLKQFSPLLPPLCLGMCDFHLKRLLSHLFSCLHVTFTFLCEGKILLKYVLYV